MKETTGAEETAAPSASENLVSSVFPSFPPSTTSFREPSSSPSSFSSSSSASTHCPTALSGSHLSSSPSCRSTSFLPSPLRSFPPGFSSSSSSSAFPPLLCAVEACPPALREDKARKEATEAAPAAAAEAEKWEEHPLFMTSMPSGEAFKRNPLLAALAAVIDEEEQLPFRAQRRRGRGGEGRRDKEEAGKRDKATTQKESLVFSSERDVERVSVLLEAEGRGTALVERDAATAVAQDKRRAEGRTARPTAATAAYRSHRNSCVPYAARQRATVGKCENEEEGREAAERTLFSEATALGTETELHRDAPASMGELQICMKMWQM